MRWRNAPRGRRYTPEMLGMMLRAFRRRDLPCRRADRRSDEHREGHQARAERKRRDRRSRRSASTASRALQGPNFKADQGTLTVLKRRQRRRDTEPAEAPVFARLAGADRIGDRSWPVPRYLRRARRADRHRRRMGRAHLHQAVRALDLARRAVHDARRLRRGGRPAIPRIAGTANVQASACPHRTRLQRQGRTHERASVAACRLRAGVRAARLRHLLEPAATIRAKCPRR